MLTYDLPLAEVIYDLHDKLKSVTKGYGTMDYDILGYFPADLCRLDILVNGKKVDALSVICHRGDADRRGRAVVKKLKEEISRHMFEVAVQAAIGKSHHREGNGQSASQKRHGQMLRWRYFSKAKADAETGQG